MYDVLDVDRFWDEEWLRKILPKEVVERIKACEPPRIELGSNKIVWKWMVTGKFSMHESYKNIFSSSPSIGLRKTS